MSEGTFSVAIHLPIGFALSGNVFSSYTDRKHLIFQKIRKNPFYITKTCLYKFDPLKPHFYIVKLGFTGVGIIFFISAQKHRLWVLVRTASPRRF